MSKTHASASKPAADLEQTRRPPPRLFLRSAWLLHRTAYRISGGRFGLSRPEAGSKFGMMRLTTIGRRSGQSRVAIIGYYEDGPNLVTLAMNGWGETDPAWWLNLQAQPDTTVELPDGSRSVRARAEEQSATSSGPSSATTPAGVRTSMASPRSGRRRRRWSSSSRAPSISLKGRSHATSS
jgi:F420H(2)-dependent quinone reductase